MAGADYMHCAKCEIRTFYDANLNYDFDEFPETGLHRTGDHKSLCLECFKTHELKVKKKPYKKEDKPKERQ